MTLTFFPRIKFYAAVEADEFSLNYFLVAVATAAAATTENEKNDIF